MDWRTDLGPTGSRPFFVADLVDVPLKADLLSLEHPLFALSPSHRVRSYEHNGVTVVVKPGIDGAALMSDRDVWIYCTSQLVEAMNRGRADVAPTVRLVAYDLLRCMQREVSGEGYRGLQEALRRLKGTVIETSLQSGGKAERAGFGLLEEWRVVEWPGSQRMAAVEVTLPDWLFRSISGLSVLSLDQGYTSIKRPLERRVYELARKHCGRQPSWQIGLSTLHRKVGSTDVLKNFRISIRGLCTRDQLPGYKIRFDAGSDLIRVYNRSRAGDKALLAHLSQSMRLGLRD
ncbi:MAG: replication initiator protein A [Gammaproteobacteria bacterium]|nr:replication initiator protein A [Gammaproteobacteria bacterium]